MKKIITFFRVQIKTLLTYLKINKMDKVLTQLMNSLLKMQFEKFSNIGIEGNKIVFHYLGGKFYILPTIPSGEPNKGYLTVYHDTTLGKEKLDLVEVTGFKVMINKFLGFTLVYIDNFMDLKPFGVAATLDANGMLKIAENSLVEWFPAQFDAKMLTDNFTIYPV